MADKQLVSMLRGLLSNLIAYIQLHFTLSLLNLQAMRGSD